MDITKVANIIKDKEFNPIYGLPEDLFLYVSTLIPMVNVDLLIKNEKNETLLSWRDDEHTGIGWHIPGGIIRYKEKAEDRIRKVALSEIGFFVNFDKDPIAINEIIANEKSIRGHFISLLYKCFLPSSHLIDNKNRKEDDAGYLRWHGKCPNNLLCYHEIYREYI